MGQIKIHDFIGYFIQRANINSILMDDFIRELENNLFELKIMQLTIQSFQADQLLSFDALVGDWKCQTRASMIIDLADKKKAINSILSDELIMINQMFDRTQQRLDEIKNYSHIERQELRQVLKGRYVSDIMKTYHIDYVPSKELSFLSLCFLITAKNSILPVFSLHKVSVNKMKFLINTVKKMLCKLSIEYEQKVATIYGSEEDQIAIQQIESQHVQQMTALFVGFRSILKKMENQQQSFVIHATIFCECGGVQKTELLYFNFIDHDWKGLPIPDKLSQAVMVIQAYQFLGSLAKLQTILGEVSPHDPLIGFAPEHLHVCSCLQPTVHTTIKSTKEALMAFFAQHPQFTNGAPIDFEGLGLMDSDLKREYDYLLTLPGFSIHDMSHLCIRHMYAATLQEVVQESRKQRAILRSTDVKTSKA
ncbi:MAG: hypothetical protein WC747_01965 [Candidatus Babeliales bacterium]|jgi:hypothetical protein